MLWLVVVAWGAPSAKDDPGPTAIVLQEVVPALDARARVARERVEARRAFFAGTAPFAVAFPRLEDADLGDAAAIEGRLALLDEAAITRAAEGAPAGLEGEAAQAHGEALAQALAAEEEADGLERRLLTSVLARLRQHPALSTPAIGAVLPPLAPPAGELDRDAKVARARHDEARARLRALARDLLVGRPPDPAPDLARLADPATAEDAARRLVLLAPFVADPEVVSALVAHFDARAAAPAVAADPQALEAALAALPAGDDPVVQARRRALEAELAATRAALEAAPVATPTTVEQAKSSAELAQQEADAARASAADARERRLADALADHASATARAAAALEQAHDARAAADTFQREVVDRLASTRRDAGLVRELSALNPDRPDPDAVYRELRLLLDAIGGSGALDAGPVLAAEEAHARAEAAVTRDQRRLDEARALLPTLSAADRARLEPALAAWGAALDDAQAAADEQLAATVSRRDLALQALADARTERRLLRPYVSSDERHRDRAAFLTDAVQEIATLPPSLWLTLRSRGRELLALPIALTDLNVIRELVSSSFWTVLVAALWAAARERADRLALLATARIRGWRRDLRPADLALLRDPLARLARHLVDLLLGSALLWSLGGALPELRVVVVVWLYLATYRAVSSAFDVAVSSLPEARPALLVLRPEAHLLLRSTVRAVVGLVLVRSFLALALWRGLALDRVYEVAVTLTSWAGWVFLAWALFRWEPFLRERLVRRRPGLKTRATTWLLQDGPAPLRIPRAVGQLGIIGAASGLELAQRLSQEGTSLAWVYNAVSRYRLTDAREADAAAALPAELVARLAADDGCERRVDRPELAAIDALAAEWRRTSRRGLVAVVGDRGSGKHTATERLGALLARVGLEVVHAPMERRLGSVREVLAWLAGVAGVPAQDTPDALVQALREAPPRTFVLEEVHRCFARRVGGIEPLGTLLYVLNATCDRHLWVVTVHGPAWDYFAAQGSLVDVSVFAAVVRLAPLGGPQLRELTLARAASAGLTLDWSAVAGQSPLAGDPEVEEERAVGLFYRLLADASGGNPAVAFHAWTRCLSPSPDPKVVRVRLGRALSIEVLPDLPDVALFVLVALNLHDALDEDELAAVTNLELGPVRTSVRDLLSRGVLCRHPDGAVGIATPELPRVQRTLRRRHFLHLGG